VVLTMYSIFRFAFTDRPAGRPASKLFMTAEQKIFSAVEINML